MKTLTYFLEKHICVQRLTPFPLLGTWFKLDLQHFKCPVQLFRVCWKGKVLFQRCPIKIKNTQLSLAWLTIFFFNNSFCKTGTVTSVSVLLK